MTFIYLSLVLALFAKHVLINRHVFTAAYLTVPKLNWDRRADRGTSETIRSDWDESGERAQQASHPFIDWRYPSSPKRA
jgi:hypothetical protein